jgi:hypothetical protein
LFAVGGFFALVRGLLVNDGVVAVVASHFYTAVMPIVVISFGQYFARDFNEHLRATLIRMMRWLFYLVLGMLVAYFYLYHIAGVWSYYGFGTGMSFVAIYMLAHKKYMRFLLGFVLDLLSGKRSGVLVATLVAAVNLRKEFPRFNIKRVLGVIVLSLSGYFGFMYADSEDYFRRYKVMFEFDMGDSIAIFYATGGRLTEVMSILDYMAENSVRWFIGGGMGAQYLFDDPRVGFTQQLSHYAHFTPMGYVFVYGLPFAALLYIGIFRRILKGAMYSGNFFYLGFLVLFFGSFFGATLFVDPRVWFFLGIVTFLVKNGEGPARTTTSAHAAALKV